MYLEKGAVCKRAAPFLHLLLYLNFLRKFKVQITTTMNDFINTGGAKIGIAKASWPFATLRVTHDKLELNVAIIGKLVFLPEDVTAITPYRGYSFMGYGIKIHHNIAHYKDEVVFWSSKSPEEIIRQIKATGFTDNKAVPAALAEVRTLQSQGGFPLKKPVAVALIVVWNVLFLSGFAVVALTRNVSFMYTGAAAALGIVAVFAGLVLVVPAFALLVLKPGRTVADVKKFLLFILIIAAFMLVNLYFMLGTALPFKFK